MYFSILIHSYLHALLMTTRHGRGTRLGMADRKLNEGVSFAVEFNIWVENQSYQ